MIDRERREAVAGGIADVPLIPNEMDDVGAKTVLKTMFILNPENQVLKRLFQRTEDGSLEMLPIAVPFIEAILCLTRLRRRRLDLADIIDPRYRTPLSCGAITTLPVSNTHTVKLRPPIWDVSTNSDASGLLPTHVSRSSSDASQEALLRRRRQVAKYVQLIDLSPQGGDTAIAPELRGDMHCRLRYYDQARQCYIQATKVNPNEVMYDCKEAGVLLLQRKYEEYSNVISKATEKARISQSQSDTHCALGESFLRSGDYRNALEEFEKAIKIWSAEARAYAGRSFAYLVLRDFSRALRDAETAISLDPQNARAWGCKGICHTTQKQLNEARAATEQATLLSFSLPTDSEINCALLKYTIHAELRDFSTALMWAEQAVKSDPKSADAWNAKGYCHLKLKELQQAKHACDFAFLCGSPESWHKATRSLVNLEIGNLESALKDAEEAVVLDPAYPLAWLSLAKYHHAIGHLAPAKAASDEAIRLSPNAVDCYLARSHIFRAMGQFEAALRDANTAVNIDACHPQAWLCKARAHIALKEKPQGLMALHKALEFDPDNDDCRNEVHLLDNNTHPEPESSN
eukprot:Protomagalhaensia_sp_Gyna_25__545@NODE_1256_length_2016_cov_5_879110_g1000_i0_p1_GENE_NODE_1256_length_2016_cov_5_879110_g1000_i0NODE_1256_length_2016_cov_5_879110_g1000_i0_p1_ORF_typecomplete_len655_score127_92TPR_16/PF13432_6/3_1TPR_16/PF13432_6/5_7e06TPR_16/PF13432_6/1_5e08TPR_16/PF13432_6/2e07TPR_16/PF13432_6/1_5e06TPR_16/PF13432_6/0_0004TPR_15/PF13429_6/5_1e09TPR_15/PF13429_6/2_1e10TPR_15/PF13429_6/2_2e06TPR_15/PF13429_6/0_00019TPR_19/PF14559_6/7TPR_19/PF14559_6/0_15TPR_19/PF14559_6/1_1e07T